jgi:hypothetical protein
MADVDLNAYTVIAPLDLPHCEEGEHEAFQPCPDCNPDLVEGARDGFVPAGEGTFKLCPTCKGTRGGGPSLGMVTCTNARAYYVPGMTVHLSAKTAKPLIAAGKLADPKAPTPIDEQIVVAAAERLGFTVSKPLT